MVLNHKTVLLLIGLASFGWAATYEGNSSLTVAGKPRESLGLASFGWTATYEGNSSLTVAGKPRESLGLVLVGGAATYDGNASLARKPKESLGVCMGENGGGSSETQFDWQGIGTVITAIIDAVTPEIPFPIFSIAWGIFRTIFNSVSGNEAESGKYFDDMEECIGKMINSAIENDHVQTARSQFKVVLKNLDNFYSSMPEEGTALEEVNLQSLIDYMNSITFNTDSLLGHVEGDRPGYHHERFVVQALEAISMEMLGWITFIQRMHLDLPLNSLACDKAKYAMKRIEDRLIRFSDTSSNEFSIQYILDNSEFNTWEKKIGVKEDNDCEWSFFTACKGDATYKVRDDYNAVEYFSCHTDYCVCISSNDICGSTSVCLPGLPGGDCPFSEEGINMFLAPYLKKATDKLIFKENIKNTISKTGVFVNIAYQEAQRKHNYICYGEHTDIKCGQHPGCGVNHKCIDGECRCANDAACPTGQECLSNGLCGCGSDTACTTGQMCSDGSCVCVNDSGCASGELCRHEVCKPDTSSECGNCVPTVDNWKEYLLSDESIEEQIGILEATVCQAEEDPVHCEEFIPVFWPMFVGIVYPVFLDGQQVCYNQGSCLKRTSMSCDYCLDLFEGISVNVASYYKIEEITDFVMANWQEHDMCNGWDACGDCECVPGFIEKGLLVMSEVIKEQADSNCCEHTPNGDCC